MAKRWLKTCTGFLLLNVRSYSFHGAAVNVTAEPYIPYWGEEEMQAPDGSKTIVYRGSDYRLVEAVASVLNFTVRVLPTSEWTEASCEIEAYLVLFFRRRNILY